MPPIIAFLMQFGGQYPLIIVLHSSETDRYVYSRIYDRDSYSRFLILLYMHSMHSVRLDDMSPFQFLDD